LPTPLEPAPRLSDALGINLLIKREDLAGLCAGGNKARLMEFALGALQAAGIDTLVASAAAQSNKLREIAAGAARCGMHAVLLLPGDDPPHQGNRLLMGLLGAEIRPLPPALDDAEVLDALLAVQHELERQGRRAAVLDRRLDYGVFATLAYVDAAQELACQLAAQDIIANHVFIAAGAGMTAAGLALGLKHLGHSARVTGVCVARDAVTLADEIVVHAERAAAQLGITTRLADGDITLTDRYLAPGYGVVTDGIRDAIEHVARAHGMVLDPVYNAKTAMALIAEAADHGVAAGDTVVMVNTGGAPGIFVHNRVLSAV
jgi:1-aminocyclopropane-1-carboxylate deaminase/D-cysteine desulfhydrase-like pyridoxal-dependent ACC family enzyme